MRLTYDPRYSVAYPRFHRFSQHHVPDVTPRFLKRLVATLGGGIWGGHLDGLLIAT